MGKGKALINKMKRRNRYLNRNRGLRRQDKINKNDERLAESPRAFQLMRGIERRLDAKFGTESVPAPSKILLEKLITANDLDRFDFGSSDFGLRLRVDLEQSGAMEITEITALADDGAFETATFTFASGATSAQADYLYFTDPAGETWAFWLDIDGAGTPPSGANYLGADNQVMVAILSTDTDVQVAGKMFTALDGAIPNMSATDNLDGTVTLTSDLLGDLADAASYKEDDTAGSISTSVDVQGSDSSFQGKYLLLHAPNGRNYHVWLNVNNEGSEPSVNNSTGIEVALNGGESDQDVASAMASAIDAEVDFDAVATLEVVEVTDDADGEATDAEDVDTGYSIAVTQQGANELNRKSFKALGVAAGDIVQILSGELFAKEYAVVEVVDDNTLRLEDDSDLSGPDTEVPCKIRLSSIKKSYY